MIGLSARPQARGLDIGEPISKAFAGELDEAEVSYGVILLTRREVAGLTM